MYASAVCVIIALYVDLFSEALVGKGHALRPRNKAVKFQLEIYSAAVGRVEGVNNGRTFHSF